MTLSEQVAELEKQRDTYRSALQDMLWLLENHDPISSNARVCLINYARKGLGYAPIFTQRTV